MVDSGILLKKQWFIQSKPGKIENYYKFDTKKLLGAGTYGTVVLGTHKELNYTRAIKLITKNKIKNQARFKTEIDIMRKMDHPNIIKLFETFEDNRNLYLVMELCTGGELFDRIIDKGYFNEHEARRTFTHIMQALNYCHIQKICHRDLKPENFLLLNKNDDSPIKVIDFGLSAIFDEASKFVQKGKVQMTTKAGTPYYISPEVLQGDYDESCDIWSAGVILYILLSGVPPFYGDTDQDILESVRSQEYSFDIPEFNVVSNSAKDLIKKMITKPSKRLKAFEVLEHPWMKIESKSDKSNLKLNWGTFKSFQGHIKFKKVALTYIASQLNESEISELGKLFKSLDKNGDGALTIEEIRSGLTTQDKSTLKEVEAVLSSIDTDGSGTIDYTEFLAATIEKNLYLKEEKLYMAFRMFDIDGSGKISASELKQTLGNDEKYKNMDNSYWEKMIKEVDKNGDGEIDYNEFIEMMEKNKLA